MSFEIYTVTVTYLDGTTEQVKATSQLVRDGNLHLYYKSGPGVAIEDHAGSWPLTSIRKWQRSRA